VDPGRHETEEQAVTEDPPYSLGAEAQRYSAAAIAHANSLQTPVTPDRFIRRRREPDSMDREASVMTTLTTAPAEVRTLADLLERIGSVPPERIPYPPAPGMATEADVLARPGGVKRLYELVEGVLVEKPMGYYESLMAGILIQLLRNYLDEHDLGIVLGEAGTLRLAPGLVRVPDVCFLSWSRFPDRQLPAEPIPDAAPDLAVEILSESNTEAEMALKLREYFEAGVRLVWYVDPSERSARTYTSLAEAQFIGEEGILEGGDVLPGFRVSLREWFDRAGRRRGR